MVQGKTGLEHAKMLNFVSPLHRSSIKALPQDASGGGPTPPRQKVPPNFEKWALSNICQGNPRSDAAINVRICTVCYAKMKKRVTLKKHFKMVTCRPLK